MDFRSLSVKELFDNPKTAAVVKEMAPQLLKYPVKMFNKKSCGEIFDRVVKVGIVPLDQAKKIEAKVNELIKEGKSFGRQGRLPLPPFCAERERPCWKRCLNDSTRCSCSTPRRRASRRAATR